MEIEWDGHCFGCGPLNTEGLRLVFTPGPEGSVAEYTVEDRFQSWMGMAHGGMVALMLDEAVGWAAWHAGHPGVTGRLQVAFRRPLKLRETVKIVGEYCQGLVGELKVIEEKNTDEGDFYGVQVDGISGYVFFRADEMRKVCLSVLS